MKLIKLTCPNCKANLETNSETNEVVCSYCRTKTIIDDEVIKVEHTITNSFQTTELKVAQTYLNDFEDYDEAYLKFDALTQTHPYEPEVWWGIILSATKKFSDIGIDYNGDPFVNLELCDDYFDKYLKVEKDPQRKSINEKAYLEYKQKLTQEITKSQEEIESYEHDIKKIIITIIIISVVVIILLNLILA